MGESSLYIFTRGDVNDALTAVLKISKPAYDLRVTASFGSPIGFNSELKFFKEMEVPDFTGDQDLPDYIDLTVFLRDNGDDTC